MRIIKEIIKENQRLWKIYHLQQECWIKEITIHYITKENLENIIRNSNIQYAILEVGSPYIDWLYSINHDIHIIIDPRSWYQIERLGWSNEQKWQEEVAVSLEKQRKEEIKEKIDAGIPYVIRQKIDPHGKTTFHDEIFGDITVENAILDDISTIFMRC